MASETFTTQLASKLDALGVDCDVYAPYVVGILEDDTLDAAERSEAILDQLAGVVEDDSLAAGLSQVVSKILEEWDASQAAKVEPETDLKSEALRAAMTAFHVRETTVASTAASSSSAPSGTVTSEKDAEVKKAILSQYMYDIDEVVEFDEQGNKIPAGKGVATKKADPLEGIMPANDNRERGKLIQQAQRVASKAEHEKEVQRIKEQKAAEALKKEKEKQRTQKKERKSGRG
eukprot:GDKH01002577.1.p1 GENE.GDKH01002577.1~~GDKH01002577.1.p1  ORF type:complete len:233 (+),score=34.89 GDKH01002577.1:158-856(+)